jgi:hypothetical protein
VTVCAFAAQVLLSLVAATQAAAWTADSPFTICYGSGINQDHDNGGPQPLSHGFQCYLHCLAAVAQHCLPTPQAYAECYLKQHSVEYHAPLLFGDVKTIATPRLSQGPPLPLAI